MFLKLIQTRKKVTELCQLLCFKKKNVFWRGLQFKIPATYVMFSRLKGWRLAARVAGVKQLPGAGRLGAKFAIFMNLAMKLNFFCSLIFIALFLD